MVLDRDGPHMSPLGACDKKRQQRRPVTGFFLLFVKNGFVGAFAEGNSDPLKQIRPPAVALAPR